MIAVLKKYSSYQVAVFLSSLSMVFGILREFLIVGLLGFTAKNDMLQMYLSIFYTVGLTIDAMRLSCLNLFSIIPLPKILLSASVVSLPLSIGVGVIMSYSAGDLDNNILTIVIIGSYLNLLAALLITFKQRHDVFLAAQIINILPNFVLIPGILVCYWLGSHHVVFWMVTLTSLIPCLQCIALLLLPNKTQREQISGNLSLLASIMVFIRHFSAMIGEQLFQIITRTAFFNYGTGYLSIFAITIRIYSGLRFILIDSYIGSKLATWRKELQDGDNLLLNMTSSTTMGLIILFLSFCISLMDIRDLTQLAIQIIILLTFGFLLSTFVRIIYFKINRNENNSRLIMRFAMYELLFASFAFLLTQRLNYSLITLLWIGYVAKPFAQLLFLRKQLYQLTEPLR